MFGRENKFERRASQKHDAIHSIEAYKDDFMEETHVNRMIYHTRLDVAMLYSLLLSANKQLRSIFWVLVTILITLIVKGL